MKKIQILILGINHQVQPIDIRSWSSNGKLQEFERDQKERFASLVRTIITERSAQLVAEEAFHGQETNTERVCHTLNCRYVNIEMTPEERQARGIPPGYNENSDFPPAERELANRAREEYMTGKALTEAGEAERVFVVCGSEHTRALAEMFRRLGHAVETTDLRDQKWYVEDWMEHMRRNL